VNVADLKKLVINAVLAGLYVGITALAATGGEFTKAAVVAAGAAALRAAVGYIADKIGHAVPVDA
jgi:hypothetical protein